MSWKRTLGSWLSAIAAFFAGTAAHPEPLPAPLEARSTVDDLARLKSLAPPTLDDPLGGEMFIKDIEERLSEIRLGKNHEEPQTTLDRLVALGDLVVEILRDHVSSFLREKSQEERLNDLLDAWVEIHLQKSVNVFTDSERKRKIEDRLAWFDTLLGLLKVALRS